MNTPTHRFTPLLHAVIAGLLAIQCQQALATDAATGGDAAAPSISSSTPLASALAQSFRGPAAAAAKTASQPRPGMHVVLRVSVVDMIAHPDSGDVRLAFRSKLLKGSIAKTPLAVAVAWRF